MLHDQSQHLTGAGNVTERRQRRIAQSSAGGKDTPFPKADAEGRTGGHESVLLRALRKLVNYSSGCWRLHPTSGCHRGTSAKRNCVFFSGESSRGMARDCRGQIFTWWEEMGRVKGLLFDLLNKKAESRNWDVLAASVDRKLCAWPCALYPRTWQGWGTPFLHFLQQVAHRWRFAAAWLLTWWKIVGNLVRWSLHTICVECADFKTQHFGVIIQHFIAAFARIRDLGAVAPSLFQVGWRVSFEQLDLALAAFHPKVLLNICGPLIFLSAR